MVSEYNLVIFWVTQPQLLKNAWKQKYQLFVKEYADFNELTLNCHTKSIIIYPGIQ